MASHRSWRPIDNLINFVAPIWPAAKHRDPSDCRAPGLTPERPVHVVMVPSLLVPPPSTAVWLSKKLSFTRADRRIVQSFVQSTLKLPLHGTL